MTFTITHIDDYNKLIERSEIQSEVEQQIENDLVNAEKWTEICNNLEPKKSYAGINMKMESMIEAIGQFDNENERKSVNVNMAYYCTVPYEEIFN